jgi:hypothetical protein
VGSGGTSAAFGSGETVTPGSGVGTVTSGVGVVTTGVGAETVTSGVETATVVTGIVNSTMALGTVADPLAAGVVAVVPVGTPTVRFATGVDNVTVGRSIPPEGLPASTPAAKKPPAAAQTSGRMIRRITDTAEIVLIRRVWERFPPP